MSWLLFTLIGFSPATLADSSVALLVNRSADAVLVRSTSSAGVVHFDLCAFDAVAESAPWPCRILRNAHFDAGDVRLQMRLNDEFFRNYDQAFRARAFKYIGAAALGGGVAGLAMSTPRVVTRTYSITHRNLSGPIRINQHVITSKPFANYIVAGIALGLVAYETKSIVASRFRRAELGVTGLDARSSALILADDDFERAIAALDDALGRSVP